MLKIALVSMNSVFEYATDRYYRVRRNCFKISVKYLALYAFLCAALTSITIIVVFIDRRHKPHGVHQFLTHLDMSRENSKLNETLRNKATNSDTRYYLNDFEYFRMILDKFPRSESAAKIGHFKSLVPLLPTQLDPVDVLFIVMGSIKYIHKAKLLTETWLQWSKGNFFIFADGTHTSIPLTTLPQFQNRATRDDAQHRQLLGSQWLIKNKSKLIERVKWFVFADDDTWVNVPAILSYLHFFDYRLLLSIGYIWDDVWEPKWSFLSGGAGIVLSRAAFMITIPAIYTKECPFERANDVTLMHCQKQKGVTKIHSDRFFYDKVYLISGRPYPMLVSYVGQVTFHYMNDVAMIRAMTCDVAVHWKRPIRGCDNITRSSLSHFQRIND